jgi:hypothetical protein
MIKNGDNAGTQWNTDKSINIFIHSLTINDGAYNYKPSWMDRLKFALGIGPTEKQIHAFIQRTFNVQPTNTITYSGAEITPDNPTGLVNPEEP